ncbi:MAG: hypothetical protein ACK4HW_06165 [Roseinatronobacter sp.]
MSIPPIPTRPEHDDELSATLAQENDPWIDLSRAGSPKEALMPHLTERYAAMNTQHLLTAASNPAALTDVLRNLAWQLARAQADIYVLKSALLGRDKLVLTQDWDYRDPIATHARSFLEGGMREVWHKTGQYSLPLDESLIGIGWHQPETNGQSTWRWSGPGLRSTLLIPRFLDGRIRMTLEFNMIKEGVLPESGGISFAGKPIGYSIQFNKGSTTQGRIETELDLNQPGKDMLPLEFHLNGTFSPAELLGKSDKRLLGISLRRISFAVL